MTVTSAESATSAAGVSPASNAQVGRTVVLRIRRLGRYLPSLGLHALAIGVGLLFLAPLIWTFLSSLKAADEIFLLPVRWLPREFKWSNYLAVWQQVPFARFTANTSMITVVAVLGEVLSSLVVAYGFARFSFPGREILFAFILATLVLPSEVTLIPRFIMFSKLNWLDTYLPLTVPYFLGGGVFYIFLLRQFLLSIPIEFDEAAEIDGAGSLRVLTSILLPQMKPALTTVAIFSFLGHWNEFMNPLIFLRSIEKYTLALGLRFFQQAAETGGEPREAYLMAASLMVTVPCILLFLATQRYFVRGVVMSGLKG